jgi:hypothetical protein
MKWRPWLAAPIALALGGCDFAPRYASPSVAAPSKFKDETAGGAALPATGAWLALVDIWGRVRDLVASANATAEASADALADARLELHAELERDYVNLRGFDDEAKLFSDTIAIYRSALKLTQDRLAAMIASPVDVDRAQTQLKLDRGASLRPRAQSRHPRRCHRRAGRQGRRLIFDLAVYHS